MRTIPLLLLIFAMGQFHAEENLSALAEVVFMPDDEYDDEEVGLPSEYYERYIERCPRSSEELKNVLQTLGKWEIEVTSPSDSTFVITLSSHEDNEPFYRPGHWWTARLEIEFSERSITGSCKRFRLNVFESTICYGPSDDPREGCQDNQGLPIDTSAEFKLRDRLGGLLREALGTLRTPTNPWSPTWTPM